MVDAAAMEEPRDRLGSVLPNNDYISFGSSWDRRVQTLAVWTGSFEFMGVLMTGIGLVLLVWCIVFPPLILAVLGYIAWALLVDDAAYVPKRPRRLPFASWWHSYADYFPVTLVKTAELSPDAKYVFGYHPHGVISCGVFGAFVTEGARTLDFSKGPAAEKEASIQRRGFSKLFPGIEPRTVTLAMNFRTPFLREYWLLLGTMVADRKTFKSVLSRGSGSAVCVVVGGAEEAQETCEGSVTLVLEKRKGFVREAMIHGAKLVPVMAFGENDLYKITKLDEDGRARQIQDKLRQKAGFSMPLARGRSIFFKFFGLMPMRRPIWVVVGASIDCPHLPKFDKNNPDHVKALDEAHRSYVNAVVELYNGYKDHPLQPYRSPDEKHQNESEPDFFRKRSFVAAEGEKQQGGLKIAS